MQSTRPGCFTLPCLAVSSEPIPAAGRVPVWCPNTPSALRISAEGLPLKKRQSYPPVVLLSVICGAMSSYWAGRKRFAHLVGQVKGWVKSSGLNPAVCELDTKAIVIFPSISGHAKRNRNSCGKQYWIWVTIFYKFSLLTMLKPEEGLKLLVTEQNKLSRPNRIKIHLFQ